MLPLVSGCMFDRASDDRTAVFPGFFRSPPCLDRLSGCLSRWSGRLGSDLWVVPHTFEKRLHVHVPGPSVRDLELESLFVTSLGTIRDLILGSQGRSCTESPGAMAWS